MTVWDQDKYQITWRFVAIKHARQTVPGSHISYLHHLGLVAMEACAVIAHEAIQNPNLLMQCSLLHDCIEDAGVSHQELHDNFGIEVADGVQALSKDSILIGKFAQMQDSLARIKHQPHEIWMVKLCDRITNMQKPPTHWPDDKVVAYRAEAQYILEQLGSANDFLATRLAKKIDEYSLYCDRR
jgi:(p)ppGpp synthase/HD superfamily hydrolase